MSTGSTENCKGWLRQTTRRNLFESYLYGARVENIGRTTLIGILSSSSESFPTERKVRTAIRVPGSLLIVAFLISTFKHRTVGVWSFFSFKNFYRREPNSRGIFCQEMISHEEEVTRRRTKKREGQREISFLSPHVPDSICWRRIRSSGIYPALKSRPFDMNRATVAPCSFFHRFFSATCSAISTALFRNFYSTGLIKLPIPVAAG